MDNVALAQINTFGTAPKADSVPPADEPVFVLTSSQLSALIEKAIQPLKDHIESLEKIVATQGEQITALEARIGLQEDNGLIQLRLIGQLREAAKKEPQPLQKDRGEILRALLAANGGKMLAKDARQKMHLGKEQFSLLLSKMDEYIEAKPFHQDKRKLVLIIK